MNNINGGHSIVAHIISLFPAPDSVLISGKREVDEFEIAVYSVPINDTVDYSWDITGGNILEIDENFVEVQWGSAGPGKVITTAIFPETGCSRESVLEVFVGDNNIIDLAETDIMILPNPVNNILYLKGNDLQDTQLELFDISGKLLFKQHINNSETSINLTKISSGVINVKITGTFGASVQKIIKR